MNPVSMAKRLFLLLATLGLLLATAASAGAATGNIYYVNASPPTTSGGSCTSWANACPDLQTALSKAMSGDQIWVAAGTYTPGTTQGDSFLMKNGVAIYGGFPSTGAPTMANRNWATNLTVLSGDIDHNDIVDANRVTTAFIGNNTHTVVDVSITDSTAVLDGFTVTGGKQGDSGVGGVGGAGIRVSNGSPTFSNLVIGGNATGTYSYGGGMATYGGSPSLTNVTFTGNQADQGGAMSVGSGSPHLTNVVFSGNTATGVYGTGAAMYVDGTPVLTNVVMSGNKATNWGGAMFVNSGGPSLTNVTISGNTAADGGGVFVMAGSVALTNSILWGNSVPTYPQVYIQSPGSATIAYSDVQGECGSITHATCDAGNINADPLFQIAVPSAPTTGGNLRLTASSPAINVGNNAGISATGVTTDLDGNPRIYPTDGTVDLGAYEYQSTPVTTYTLSYGANGGSGTAPADQQLAAGASFTTAAASTFTAPTGKQFKEWNTAASGTGSSYAAGASVTMPASKLTLYAIWESITYTVTFDSQGGSSVTGQNVAYGGLATQPADPTKTGYTFGGWYKEAACTNAWDFSTDTVTAVTTLYAKWTATNHTVTFDSNVGSGTMSPQVANVPTALTANSFTRMGYSFSGWNTASNGSGTAYADGATYSFSADVTLYAQWTAVTYTLSYNANGGSGTAPADQQLAAGASFTTAPASAFTALAGKQFKEWNTASDDSGTGYLAGATVTMPTSNLTLYAIWENIITAPTVTTQPSNQKVVVGQTATFTAAASGNPTPTVQWQVSTNGGKKWSDISGAAGATLTLSNVTLRMDGNQYRAVFSNSLGSATSNVATLTVTAGDSGPLVDAGIKQESGTYDSITKTITWTLTVTNGSSTDAAEGVEVTDTLAKGTNLSSVSLEGGTPSYVTHGSKVIVTLGELGVDSSKTITIKALVTRASGTVDNTATVTTTSNDTNTMNNTSTASVIVQ